MLGDGPVTIESLERCARGGATVEVSAAARRRVAEGRRVFEAMLKDGARIYGVNTGVGANVKFFLSDEQVSVMQRNILNHLACGTGQALPADVVRGAIVLRMLTLTTGFSAVRPELVDALGKLIACDIVPIVPRYGSLGASGDLIPSAYAARALLGEGDVWYRGERVPAEQALERAGLPRFELAAKEGLALVNGTTSMTAVAAILWGDARRVLRSLLGLVGLAIESMGAPASPYHPFVHDAKGHPGQIAVAEYVRALLAGSSHATESPIQSCYSLRCAPQGLGPAWEALEADRAVIEREMNSANDNPLVDPARGALYQAGNFYGGHMARVLDSWKLDFAVMAGWANAVVAVLLDDRTNRGLPANLVASPGVNSGFKGLQLSVTSLACATRQLGAPSLIHSLPTDQYNQDMVSLGMHAAVTAMDSLACVRDAVAMGLLAACQAVDLRGGGSLGAGSQRVYQAVRRRAQKLELDRPLDRDVQSVAAGILAGEFDVESR
jgi:phenylalanine ammonia-lyase